MVFVTFLFMSITRRNIVLGILKHNLILKTEVCSNRSRIMRKYFENSSSESLLSLNIRRYASKSAS